MKTKRYKKAEKILTFFQHNFGIKAPYRVLLDATFCVPALAAKVNIRDQLPKYLGSLATKIVTTQCSILEVEKLSKLCPTLYGCWLVLKQFSVHNCGHEGRPLPAASCLKSILRKYNPHKYILATNDDEFKSHIHRRVYGVPILYLHHNAPTLEKPSEKSLAKAKESSGSLSTYEVSTLKELKLKYLGETEEEPVKKRRKKAKEPNPLCCKKKKKKPNTQQNPEKSGNPKKKQKRSQDVNANQIIETDTKKVDLELPNKL